MIQLSIFAFFNANVLPRYIISIYRVSQKKFHRLAGYGVKGMCPIFKTKMLIFQAKANLHGKILFGKIIHHLSPEIERMLLRRIYCREKAKLVVASKTSLLLYSSSKVNF